MAISGEYRGKPREKTMKLVNKDNKKLYLVAHELKLARVLAGNNKAARDRALKALKQWFTQRSKTVPFTEDDFQRIWKGLFYAMWMSDKPLVQEECAENISKLVHFPMLRDSLLFFKAGMIILINEWFGIDQLRLDKFLMLVRRLLRQMFVALKEYGLSKKNIDGFADVLSNTILNTNGPLPIGLFMHFTEIFLEEFAKVTNGNISPERFVDLLRPFIKKLVVTDDRRQSGHIRKFIFTYLIRQTNLGLEYQAKYQAWKQMGFPGNINSMQKIKLHKDEIMSDDEDEGQEVTEKPLDPRAGRVNVELPQIKFNPKLVAAALLELKFDKDSKVKSRKLVDVLADQFTKLGNGIYPLGVKKVIDDDKDSYDTNIRKAANRLIKFENKLLGKNKKRKRKSEDSSEKSEVKVKRRKMEENSSEEKQVKNKKIKTSGKKNNDQELAEFIKKSEESVTAALNGVTSGKIEKKKKKKKSKSRQTIIDNIECVFERNSGTWVVYDVSNGKGSDSAPSQQTDILIESRKMKQSPSKSSEHSAEFTESTVTRLRTKSSTGAHKPDTSSGSPSMSQAGSNGTDISVPSKIAAAEQNGSPKSGLNPVKLFESPQKPKELFPKSEWDEPLQEGEYEICIPSKKFVGKMRNLAKKNRQSLHELINTSLKIKGKIRYSLESNAVKNVLSTPTSTKKVKINTKLNMSQEVHEHHEQIRNSPGIPYDANKKPSKPLLKTVFNSTPLNPFYNKQLNVC